MDTLSDLLRLCTLKIADGMGHGTGFFVASGLVLTCAHVVKVSQGKKSPVQVYWKGHRYDAEITAYRSEEDLALLQVRIAQHPWVPLDEQEKPVPFDKFYSYGYPDNHPGGDPATFELEGIAGEQGERLKYKMGQVRPGFSGAPLLNMRTGSVSGLIQQTRDRTTDLGGQGLPLSTILLVFPELKVVPKDPTWTAAYQTAQGSQQNRGRNRINNHFPKAAWTPPLMLPPRAQSFVGREEDLSWLLQQLTGEAGKTLALCGSGGMGKTALAAEALSHLVAQEDWLVHCPDGIFYHSFYTYPSLAVAFEELARVFEEDPDADPRRAAVRALSRRRALLVFDGVEVLADTRPLRELGGKNVVLLLSRRRSDAPDQAHRRDLGALSQEQAIRLLQELAGPHAADRQSVEQLVQEIGGYPLALQLIGNYLSSNQEEIADYLQWFWDEGLAAIHFGEHQVESIPVLLQHTYESLAQSSQQLFLLLGLLAPAPFPLELVQEILQLPERAIRQALGSLVNMSVLRRSDLSYEVSHPLVHSFATELLSSQMRVASSPFADSISTWQERFLETLSTHVDKHDPYDRIALARWYPHVFLLVSDEHLTVEQSLRAARLFNAVSFAALTQGKYAEAEPLYQRALTIREQRLGSSHPDTANSLNGLAVLYSKQGKYAQADPLYVRALAIREQQLGPSHPDTALCLDNLAVLYFNQGKYTEAEPLYQRALTIFEQQLGPHPTTAFSLNNLAVLYFNQGKYTEAEPLYQRALTIFEQQLGPSHPTTASSLNNLAALYFNQGKYTKVEPLYQRALTTCEQQLGPSHPDTAGCLNNLAMLYDAQGKYAEAEPLLRRALTICEHILGQNHSSTQTVRANYTSLLQAIEQGGEAMP